MNRWGWTARSLTNRLRCLLRVVQEAVKLWGMTHPIDLFNFGALRCRSSNYYYRVWGTAPILKWHPTNIFSFINITIPLIIIQQSAINDQPNLTSERITPHHHLIFKIMQFLKTSPAEPSGQHSSTPLIATKLTIALTRTLLYTLTIHYNGFQLSSLYINLALAIPLFLLAQLAIWYRRFDCALASQQFNVSLTVLAHLYALANVILLAVSINLWDHQPRQLFFQIFMGQMVNYMLTLIAVHQALSIFLVKNCEDFANLFQPVEDSMIYLFVAYFMGIFCDFIAFAQLALIELYIFAAIAVLYLTIKSVFVDDLKTKLKKLFAE